MPKVLLFTRGVKNFVRQACFYLFKQDFELKKLLAYNEKLPANIKETRKLSEYEIFHVTFNRTVEAESSCGACRNFPRKGLEKVKTVKVCSKDKVEILKFPAILQSLPKKKLH